MNISEQTYSSLSLIRYLMLGVIIISGSLALHFLYRHHNKDKDLFLSSLQSAINYLSFFSGILLFRKAISYGLFQELDFHTRGMFFGIISILLILHGGIHLISRKKSIYSAISGIFVFFLIGALSYYFKSYYFESIYFFWIGIVLFLFSIFLTIYHQKK